MAWDKEPLLQKCLTEDQINALREADKEFVGDKIPMPIDIDRETAVDLMSRSVSVFGQVLDDVALENKLLRTPAAWLASLGRFLWFVAEAVVPRRPFYAFLQYWYQTALTLSLTAWIVVYALNAGPSFKSFLTKLILVLVVLGFLTQLLRRWARHQLDMIPRFEVCASFVYLVGATIYCLWYKHIPLFSIVSTDSRVIAYWLSVILIVLGFVVSYVQAKIGQNKNKALR